MIPPKEEIPESKEYENDDETAITIPENEDATDINGRLINQQPAYDKIINAEVQLPIGDGISLGKVKQISISPDDTTTGEYIDDPFMNSIVYEVELPDKQVREYSANIIAQNMITQVDHEGYCTTLMNGIGDYKKDDAVNISKAEKYFITRRGPRQLRKSTLGWNLLVQCKDGSDFRSCLQPLRVMTYLSALDMATALSFL